MTATKSAGGLIQFLMLRDHGGEGALAGNSLKMFSGKAVKKLTGGRIPGA
jgi:hypothetical protein